MASAAHVAVGGGCFMVAAQTWLGLALGVVLVLVGAYLAWLEGRVRRLEEAREDASRERP